MRLKQDFSLERNLPTSTPAEFLVSFCFNEIKNAAMVIAFPQNSVAQNFRHETRAQTWRCDVPEKQLTICREPARVIEMAFEGGSILRAVLGAGHAVPQIHLLSLLASRGGSTAILQTPRMEGPSRPVPNDKRRVDLGQTRSYCLVFVVGTCRRYSACSRSASASTAARRSGLSASS